MPGIYVERRVRRMFGSRSGSPRIHVDCGDREPRGSCVRRWRENPRGFGAVASDDPVRERLPRKRASGDAAERSGLPRLHVECGADDFVLALRWIRVERHLYDGAGRVPVVENPRGLGEDSVPEVSARKPVGEAGILCANASAETRCDRCRLESTWITATASPRGSCVRCDR
jgi:hypothetical protein